MIEAPLNPVLPSSTGGAAVINLPSAIDGNIKDYAIQARDSVDMKISDVEALTTYFTIKADGSLSLSQVLRAGKDMFYAISGGAASVIEILPLKK